MKTFSLLFLLASATSQTCFAQDQPITAVTTTITVLTTGYSTGTTACSAFSVKSIMSGIVQTLNIGSQSTGSGAGKVMFNPFTIAKNVDTCSAMLFIQAASGTPFQEVIAVIEAPKSMKQPTFLIRLGLAAVATLDDSASDGTTLLEKVTFQYGDLTIAQWDPVSRSTSCSGWNGVKNISDSSSCSELTTIASDRYNNGTTR